MTIVKSDDLSQLKANMSEVTRIQNAIGVESANATDEMLPIDNQKPRNLASQKMAHEQPSTLLNESNIRVIDVEAARRRDIRGHLFAIAIVAIHLGLGVLIPPLSAGPLDRRAAEWAIQMHGSVRLVGDVKRISDLGQLPQDEFQLELVNLVGANIIPTDLRMLIGLERLKIVTLPGPMWNTRAGSRTDFSRELRHLAGLKTLEELTFSYTYLQTIKFKDEGVKELKPLADRLKLLSLENTDVSGRHLAALKNLESLDLISCPVTDEGVEQIRGLTKLRRLLLRDALISDAGMQSLSKLVNLEHLDLGGTQISDVGIKHLRGMTQLRKLNLLGADLTDAGLVHLGEMNLLEELNFYGTKISNVGIDALKKLENLRHLDLRYTRASQAGVDSLLAALPRCQVAFVDTSMRPSIPPDADKIIRDAPDTTIAKWVHAIGGQTIIRDARLSEVSLASTSVTDELLANLVACQHIHKLQLQFTDVSDLGVQHLAAMVGLQELDLSGTTVSDNGLAHLNDLTSLRTLRLTHTLVEGKGLTHLKDIALEELHLSSSPINDDGLQALSQIRSLREVALAYTNFTDDGLEHLNLLPYLKRLDLGGSDVGDAGLAHLKTMTGLTSLLLSYSRITEGGVQNLEKLKHLKELALIRTRVTDGSMKVIGSLPELETLNLDYTEVGDDGLEALAGLSKLRKLSLDSTDVTEASIDGLAGFPHLIELNLYHTPFTEQGYKQIHDAVPQCKIIWDPKSSDPKRRRS